MLTSCSRYVVLLTIIFFTKKVEVNKICGKTCENRMIELYVSTFLVVVFRSVKKLPCKDVCFSHPMLCSVFTSFNAFEYFVNLKVFVLYICVLFIKYTRFYKSWMWGYFCCFFLVWFKCHFMQKQWSWFYECKSSVLIIIHKLQK